jgi:hypothetical protein
MAGALWKSESTLHQSRLHALQDDQFNVTTLTDTSGNVVERYG